MLSKFVKTFTILEEYLTLIAYGLQSDNEQSNWYGPIVETGFWLLQHIGFQCFCSFAICPHHFETISGTTFLVNDYIRIYHLCLYMVWQNYLLLILYNRLNFYMLKKRLLFHTFGSLDQIDVLFFRGCDCRLHFSMEQIFFNNCWFILIDFCTESQSRGLYRV